MENVSSIHNFVHKTFGKIGSVDFTANVEATLNGYELGGKAIDYLIGYGIRQVFTDCYSGAAKLAEKKGIAPLDAARDLFNRKVNAVIDGKISIRERLDEFSRIVLELTDKAFEESAKMTFAAFAKSVDDEEKSDEVYARFAESVRVEMEAKARERMERESGLTENVGKSVADLLAEVKGQAEPVLIKGKKGK